MLLATLIPLVVNVALFILFVTTHTAKFSTAVSSFISTFTNFLIASLFTIFVLLYAAFRFSTITFLAAFHSVVSSLRSAVFHLNINRFASFTKFKLHPSHR
ncbi:hypothetical protein HOG21_04935 [bacterium]|nr:hypothetical protein [bacterium]